MLKLVILIIYFAVLIGIGLYCRKHATDVNGFVLGGRSVGPWLTAFAYGTSYLLYSLDMQASLAGNTALPQPGLVSATRLLVHSLHGSYLAEEQEL